MVTKFFLLTLLLACNLEAATRYVDNSGSPACSNSGSGTSEANPWCTVVYGIEHMSGGDTLYVKNGTYNEADYIVCNTALPCPNGSSGAHTIISAYPGHRPVLRGTGYVGGGRWKFSHGCSYFEFRNFDITFTNEGLYLDDDAGTSTPCTHMIMYGIHVYDIGQSGIVLRSGSDNTSRDWLIDNCLVYDTGKRGTSFDGEGFYVGNSNGTDNTNGVTIQNNEIHNTQDEGIELKGDTHDIIVQNNILHDWVLGSTFSSNGGYIEIDEPRNSPTRDANQIIRGNTIYHITTGGGTTKRGIRAGTGAIVYNNILYDIDSSFTCILANTANASQTRLIYHNTIDCTTGNSIVINDSAVVTTANNIGPNTTNNTAISSAFFVDYANHNYHLVSTASAVRGTGINVLSVVPVDKDGVARTATPDRGAYQYLDPTIPVSLRRIRTK